VATTLLSGVFENIKNDFCVELLPISIMVEISLTTKETEIIRLIAEGKTTPSIAAALGLAPETVKWYRKRILDKLQASTSAEVVRKAIDLKLI